MKGVFFIAFCGLLFPLSRQIFIYKSFVFTDIQVLNLSLVINAYQGNLGPTHVV